MNSITSVLNRIDRNIQNIGRALIDNNNVSQAQILIDSCLLNLNRIEQNISVDQYNAVNTPLQRLSQICLIRSRPATISNILDNQHFNT